MTGASGSSEGPRFAAPGGLLWEAFDESYLVFDPRCDEIHRLNPTAAALLSELETAPLSSAQVAARLAALTGTTPDSEARQQAQALLRQFDELGLITPIGPGGPGRPDK